MIVGGIKTLNSMASVIFWKQKMGGKPTTQRATKSTVSFNVEGLQYEPYHRSPKLFLRVPIILIVQYNRTRNRWLLQARRFVSSMRSKTSGKHFGRGQGLGGFRVWGCLGVWGVEIRVI